MSRHHKVSVIIPTFNRADYLQQAIASVLNQSYVNFEIIIIDDGSTDDTFHKVKGFSDPRIRYFYQDNQGRAVVRNRGLENACGEYIAFLDDDDLFLPDKLSVQTAYLDSHPKVDVAVGGGWFANERGKVTSPWLPWQDNPDLSLTRCMFGCPILTCAVLFRRRVLDDLEYWFDPDLPRAQDTDFFLRMLAANIQFAWTKVPTCVYRQHPHNIQVDGLLYRQSYQRIVERLLSFDTVQSALCLNTGVLRAHYLALSAFHELTSGHQSEASQDLASAVESDPGLLLGDPPKLVQMLVGFASSPRVKDAQLFLQSAFLLLPDRCVSLRSYQTRALSNVYMQRVFAAHDARQLPKWRDWLLGVTLHPRWLANRGVWSILVRDLILRRPTTDVKA